MTGQDFVDVLEDRRSCRAYTSDRVPREIVEKIVEAGTWAPSGMGRQAYRFVVVTDPEVVAHLSRMNAAIMGRDIDPFYGASTVVVTLADPSAPTHVYDGSLAMGNMLNAAYALGVDACWIHRAKEEFESDEGKALLRAWGLPEDLVGIGHCILGYAAEGGRAPAKPRRDDLVTWA